MLDQVARDRRVKLVLQVQAARAGANGDDAQLAARALGLFKYAVAARALGLVAKGADELGRVDADHVGEGVSGG